ncbi:acetoacetate-CoA ligase [Spinellus fusiger]|nr:acetoacetate-CoA ligase [Spinellus fusiger]
MSINSNPATDKALSTTPECLWVPSNVEDTEMEKFKRHVNSTYSLQLTNYQELWKWSVTDPNTFWSAVWDYTSVLYSKPANRPGIDLSVRMDAIPEWFQGARLNYAENLLWQKGDRTAIIATGEGHAPQFISYDALYQQVLKCAEAMKKMGIKVGDRVAAYISNCPEAIVAMLAANSLGAVWSSTSPDFGTAGVLDRFSQIEPRILFSINAVHYNGKLLDHTVKLNTIAQGLSSVEKVIVIPFVRDHKGQAVDKSQSWNDFLASVPSHALPSTITFEQLPFNHPAFILFSSGTTGLPKCIVHSSGGLLLQLKKEHILHGDMKPDDVTFFYTTTGWMMWNWLSAALSVGCTIVLWDGSPFRPAPISLWKLVDELQITHFGVSAKYIQSLQEASISPKSECSLSSLKVIYSTGSPLKPESFDYVYSHVKKDVLLGSITGGTDICSLFAGHNAALPVYRGEIQCICLGMKIEAWTDTNTPVYAESADLVCTVPFPCMPVYMYADPGHAKYKAAYFDQYDNIWYHGDFVWINPNTGGVVMLGRSDGTLNPSGVRFGSAEIYNVVDVFAKEGVEDSLCVGQKIKDQDDERVVLFVKMKSTVELTGELVRTIKTKIRSELSPRHVPAFILAVQDIPHTINGKKVEVAVKRIISGQKVTPTGTLVNPESLSLYYDIPELRQ